MFHKLIRSSDSIRIDYPETSKVLRMLANHYKDLSEEDELQAEIGYGY